MSDNLPAAIRISVRRSGWAAKRDVITTGANGWVLAVYPRRGLPRAIEFHAKPIAWDRLLWSILQIHGNDKQPLSFHFWGAFTCDTAALVAESIEDKRTHAEVAASMVSFAQRCREAVQWNGYDLATVISAEQPQAPYRYHMTRVVERIDAGDRTSAQAICEAAHAGELDLRGCFYSIDQQMPPDSEGRRPSLSFFELAQIWMSHN